MFCANSARSEMFIVKNNPWNIKSRRDGTIEKHFGIFHTFLSDNNIFNAINFTTKISPHKPFQHNQYHHAQEINIHYHKGLVDVLFPAHTRQGKKETYEQQGKQNNEQADP